MIQIFESGLLIMSQFLAAWQNCMLLKQRNNPKTKRSMSFQTYIDLMYFWCQVQVLIPNFVLPKKIVLMFPKESAQWRPLHPGCHRERCPWSMQVKRFSDFWGSSRVGKNEQVWNTMKYVALLICLIYLRLIFDDIWWYWLCPETVLLLPNIDKLIGSVLFCCKVRLRLCLRQCIPENVLRSTELFMWWNLTSDCCSVAAPFSCSNFPLVGFCCGCCCFEHVERSAVFGCPIIFQICPCRCKPESPSWFQLDAGLFFKQESFLEQRRSWWVCL